jgi:polysaccharide biosynthesis protein PslH
VAVNVMVSEIDVDRLRRVAPESRCAVVPNGVDCEFYRPASADHAGAGLVFVGSADWAPNRDAMHYLVEQILPRIGNGHGPRGLVRWVGRVGEREDRAFSGVRGLELAGEVSDIRPSVSAAACFVVPLRVGGGTRLKILHAWALGKAVVSTPLGCEGLDARHGENILLADSAEAFAAATRDVLDDPALRQRLGAAGRRTVERQYDWNVVGDGLGALYRDLAARRSARS